MENIKNYRSYSVDFKREIARAHSAGKSMYALAKQYKLSRNLVRTWVEKFEAGELDEEPAVSAGMTDPSMEGSIIRATTSQSYEARIANLERMIGRQAIEIEVLKEALQRATQGRKRD